MADSLAIPSEGAAELRRTRVGVGLLALYGSGAIVDAVFQAMLATFLFFYLTAVCGLSNSLAGLSLFIALVFDAVIDPMVGSISDNSTTRWGRRHPFMLVSAFPMAVALGLLFSIPTAFSAWALFAYVTVVSIALRMSHSFFLLPYTALGAELTDDYAARTNVVASRFLFQFVGTFACLSIGLMGFLSGPQGKMHRAAYAPFGWVCAGLIIASALIAVFGTRGALARLHRVAPAEGSIATRLVRDVREIFRNRSFVFLFLTLVVLFTGAGTVATLNLHALTFFWNAPANVIQAVLLASPLGGLVGVPVSVFIANRVEKRIVVLACIMVLVAYHASVPVLQVLGWLPAGPALWAILIGFSLFLGAVVVCAGIGFQSMMADAADEHESLFGTRREGLYYAGLNFSAKAATGLGALIAGLGLDLIGFPTNLAVRGGANLHIATPILHHFGLIIGPLIAVIYAISAAVFLGYRLDRPRYAKIQAILEERRKAAQTSAAAEPV